MGKNNETQFTIKVELAGDSKKIQQAIKDGLSKDFSAKIGADTSKLSRDINTAIKELNSSDKKVKIGIDGSNIVKDINNALKSIESDSLKKVKLGADTSNLLRDINKAITTINSSESLKKLKLGVDVNYLQQQLNKAVRGLDTTVKLKTKLETTSRTSETKGTVTTNKTSKEEAQQYQSLFSKRAESIMNLDRAYQEFGRNSREVNAALKEFAAASKDVRKFGRDTGVLSLNKVKSDIERQLGAGLTTDFTKNWLRMEYDKVLRDIDTLNRQLKPEKYEKAEDDARVKAYNEEYKIRQAIASVQAKADKDAERAYKERERVLNEELKIRLALGKKGLSGGLSVDEVKNIKEANQATTALSSQFARLRGEALKAGNALNQATNPKDVERLKAEFEKAIQALVNYQRATRGLTKAGEAQLVEKLAIGNIKEQTRAYKVLVDWIKKAVQAQRDLDVATGRRKLVTAKDTDLLSWFKNIDIGRAVSGSAYAARGELNLIQSLGGLISSLSKVSGVVGTLAKGLGVLALAGLAVFSVISTVETAFSSLVNILGRVIGTIYDILRPGIELYKTRQTAELATAAAISSRATEEGKSISFDRAVEVSAQLMQRVMIDAARSAFNPQELIDALRGTLPLAFGKGFNLEQAYDLTKGVASVAKVINLAPNQVLQELRDILQGTISARSSQVAGATGMTGEELREAEAQGRLYEYISEHLSNFTIALDRYSYTLAGALDRLAETWALGMEHVFQRIAPVVNNLLNAFIDNFIVVYRDKLTGEIVDISKSENLLNPETGEYRELVPDYSNIIDSFGDALVDLVQYIAPIVDEILAFIQELTGEEDAMKAVASAIKYVIRMTVIFGEIIASVFKATMVTLDTLEAPISWVLGLLVGLSKAIYHFGDMCVNLGVAIGDAVLSIKKALTGDLSFKDAENSVRLGNKVASSFGKMIEDVKQSLTTTSYDELFGINTQKLRTGGQVTELVEKAIADAKKESERTNKPIDMKNIEGTLKDSAKQSVADQRRMIQAMIEDIKQALKQALAELKDIAEQNELAYQQGYKSIKDYFTQKAEIEAEEARLKLEAAIAERDAIASLDTGGDASAEYQKQRDLIKYNSDIATYTREYGKKVDQSNELLAQIDRTLNNKTFQRGIVSATGSAVGNKVAQEAVDRLGEPTEYGGDGEVSFDCSSLTMKVNSEAGIEIPRTADEQKRQHDEQQTFHDLQEVLDGLYIPKPGDSVYFRAGDTEDSYDSIGHVEIVKAFRDGILETISGGNYGVGVLEKERELGDYEMAGFGSVDELAQKLGVVTQEAQQATESLNQIEGQMPQTYSKLATEYNKMVKEGQKQLIDVQKEYAKTLNDPDLLKAINLAEVEATMKEKIAVARNRFKSIPAIADTLEKLLPISQLKAEVSALVDNANMRIKIIEHDAMAMNKYLREKTVLYPQAIEKYFSYFYGKDGLYSIGGEMDRLMQIADEYKKGGQIGLFHETMTKIDELRSKFTSMIDSWISEMSNYFDYRRQLVEADSGLTNFVKEERKSQLDKGEARVRAVAYRAEATKLAEEEAKLQEIINKEIAAGNNIEGSAVQYEMQRVELAKQHAERQAEVNEMLGKQKTLWQETMDATNQALENGLYNFMTDYINTAKSIGEAFRNMAIDILKDLQKFFAKKAITDLMHVITGTPNVEYQAPSIAETQTASNTSMMLNQMITANTYLAQIAGQNMMGSSPMLGTSSYGNYNYATSALPPVNSSLGMFGYKDYETYKMLTVSAPGVESSVANSTAQTVATTTGFQNQMTTMLPNLFGALGGTLISVINALGTIAASLGLLYLTYMAISFILNAVVEVSRAILDAVVEIGHAILDAVVDIGKEFVKLFAYVAGLILDWNTSATGLARAIFGNSDDDAVEQTDAVTLLSSILNTLSAIYSVSAAIAGKMGVSSKDYLPNSPETEESEDTPDVIEVTEGSGDETDTLLEENKMLVDSIYQRRVIEKLDKIVSSLGTILKLNVAGLVMQLLSIVAMGNVGKSFKSTFKNDFGFAEGGYISGAGTSTSDSIHAMLSNGEYVIKADAVKKYGLNFLNAVNNGYFTRMKTYVPRFADGGYVGDAMQDTARGMVDFARNIGTSVSTTNNMNIALVEDREAGMNHFMRSPKGQNILVDFMKGNGRVFARFNS